MESESTGKRLALRCAGLFVCQREADNMPSVFKLEKAAKEDKTLQMSLRSNINLLSKESW